MVFRDENKYPSKYIKYISDSENWDFVLKFLSKLDGREIGRKPQG